MALQKTLSIEELGGLEVTDAYIVARHIRVNPSKTGAWTITAAVQVYKDEAAAQDINVLPVRDVPIRTEINLDQEINSVAWLYNQLKQLDWLQGAVDV